MQLAVSFNKAGEITVMFEPHKMRNDQFTIMYEPGPGESHHILDLPKQFEGKPFHELAHSLRVNASGAAPKLEAKA